MTTPMSAREALEELERLLGGPFTGTEGFDSFTLAWAIGRIRALAASLPKQSKFPVMWSQSPKSKPGPMTIPWQIAEYAYSVYSRRYGTSQSLERLAERGGFHADELDEFLPDWREQSAEKPAIPEGALVDGLHPVVHEAIDSYAKYYAEHHKLGLSIRDDMRYIAQVATRWAQPQGADIVLVPRNQIVHLQEYWNGSRNDSAMWDALNHIMDELQTLLAAAPSPTGNVRCTES